MAYWSKNTSSLALPQYEVEDFPPTADDPEGYRLYALLQAVRANPPNGRTDTNTQEMTTTSINLLRRLTAATFELEMRLNAGENRIHGTDQQEHLEELRSVAEAREVSNAELGVHVLSHIKQLTERLETVTAGAAECDARLWCKCCMDLGPVENSLGVMSVMCGKITLREHLAAHMDPEEANSGNAGLRAYRERGAMQRAHRELGLLFRQFIPEPPSTVAQFTAKWRDMWQDGRFRGLLQWVLQSRKDEARVKMEEGLHDKVTLKPWHVMYFLRKKESGVAGSEEAPRGRGLFLSWGRAQR